jgi:hypothetical protein
MDVSCLSHMWWLGAPWMLRCPLLVGIFLWLHFMDDPFLGVPVKKFSTRGHDGNFVHQYPYIDTGNDYVRSTLIFCLCYFSCYNMVAKFYCQDYVFYAHV